MTTKSNPLRVWFSFDVQWIHVMFFFSRLGFKALTIRPKGTSSMGVWGAFGLSTYFLCSTFYFLQLAASAERAIFFRGWFLV